MGDLGSSSAEQDADDVETQGIETGGSLGQVLFGHQADRLLFAGGDGLQGVAVGRATTEFDLDDHEGVGAASDQVEFAAAGTVVALDDLVALAGQVAARYLLPEPAGGPVVQAPTPA